MLAKDPYAGDPNAKVNVWNITSLPISMQNSGQLISSEVKSVGDADEDSLSLNKIYESCWLYSSLSSLCEHLDRGCICLKKHRESL
jgi:hypothetical protein